MTYTRTHSVITTDIIRSIHDLDGIKLYTLNDICVWCLYNSLTIAYDSLFAVSDGRCIHVCMYYCSSLSPSFYVCVYCFYYARTQRLTFKPFDSFDNQGATNAFSMWPDYATQPNTLVFFSSVFFFGIFCK